MTEITVKYDRSTRSYYIVGKYGDNLGWYATKAEAQGVIDSGEAEEDDRANSISNNARRIIYEAQGKCACPEGAACPWCEVKHLAQFIINEVES